MYSSRYLSVCGRRRPIHCLHRHVSISSPWKIPQRNFYRNSLHNPVPCGNPDGHSSKYIYISFQERGQILRSGWFYRAACTCSNCSIIILEAEFFCWLPSSCVSPWVGYTVRFNTLTQAWDFRYILSIFAGADRFYDNIEMMYGFRISPFMKTGWLVMSPIFCMVSALFTSCLIK